MHSSIKAGPCFRTLAFLCTLVFSATAAASSSGSGQVPNVYQGYPTYGSANVEPVATYHEHNAYADQGYNQQYKNPAHYAGVSEETKYLKNLNNFDDDYYGNASEDWQEEPRKVTKKSSRKPGSRRLLQEPGQQAYPQESFSNQGMNTPQQVPYQGATPGQQIPYQGNPGQQLPNNQGIIYPPGTPDWVVSGEAPPEVGHMDHSHLIKVKDNGSDYWIPAGCVAGLALSGTALTALCYCNYKNKKNKQGQGQGHAPSAECSGKSCEQMLPIGLPRSDKSMSKEGYKPSKGMPIPPQSGPGGRSSRAPAHFRKRDLSAGKRMDLFSDEI